MKRFVVREPGKTSGESRLAPTADSKTLHAVVPTAIILFPAALALLSRLAVSGEMSYHSW